MDSPLNFMTTSDSTVSNHSATPSPTETLTTSPSQTKKKINRFQGKRWFLTFPQNSLPRQQAWENLTTHYPPTEWAIIAEEKHKDGTPHLHVALIFQEPISTRDMNYFDRVTGKHGNYQPMKSQRACVAYVTKAGEYDAYGIDVKAILAKKCGTFTTMAKELRSGKGLDHIDDLDPGFLLQHKRKCEEYLSWSNRRRERESKKPWIPFRTEDIEGSSEIAEMQIMTWLNLNIKEPRDFRQTQLYIYGPPKMGKSTLIRNLNNYLSIYYVPRDDGEFCDEYEDGIYDLIVLDEFTNKKTMQWMNQLLDGQTCYLKKKGGQILKKDNLPVIILSNFSLEQNYPRLNESGMLEPLISRLKIVNVQSFINVPFRDQ